MFDIKRPSIEDIRSLPDICGSCNFIVHVNAIGQTNYSERLSITNTSFHFDSANNRLYLEYYVVSDANEALQQLMLASESSVDVLLLSVSGELICKHTFRTTEFSPVGDVRGTTAIDMLTDPIKIKLCAKVISHQLFDFNVGEKK